MPFKELCLLPKDKTSNHLVYFLLWNSSPLVVAKLIAVSIGSFDGTYLLCIIEETTLVSSNIVREICWLSNALRTTWTYGLNTKVFPIVKLIGDLKTNLIDSSSSYVEESYKSCVSGLSS